MKKALKVLTATAAMSAMMAAPALADVSTTIYFNDELVNTTQPVMNVQGRTLLAMRDLFENLEGEVSWDDHFRSATLAYRDKEVKLFPDTGVVQVNGSPINLAVKPQIINDRIYLPLRFVAQTLGSTVDYTKGPNDTGIIQIHSIDSVQNFAQKEGKVTKILRTTAAPVNTTAITADNKADYERWQKNNSAYFVDDHNNLIEVFSANGQIQVNVIDALDAKVDTKTYAAGVAFPALTSITKDSMTYNIGINESVSKRYVGVGTPTSSNYSDIISTNENGDLTLYPGLDTDAVLRFNASTDSSIGVTSANVSGKVLDLIDRSYAVDNASYAISSDGAYGFLLDNELLIIGADGVVKEDLELTREIGDATIFSSGDQFIVIGVDKDNRYPDLSAAVYTSEGIVKEYFHTVGNISKAPAGETFYPYNNLQIIDAAIVNSTVYVLAKTDMDYYLVSYNAKTYEDTKEQLSIKEKTYQGFIHTMDDVKLFSMDKDYFYLRDVK